MSALRVVPVIAADGVWAVVDSLLGSNGTVALYVQRPGANPLASSDDIEVLCVLTADGLAPDTRNPRADTSSGSTFEHLRPALASRHFQGVLLSGHRDTLNLAKGSSRSSSWTTTSHHLNLLASAHDLDNRDERVAAFAMIAASFTGTTAELTAAARAAAHPPALST